MTTRAAGTFNVRVTPQAPAGNPADATLGRMTIDQTFEGDLQGTSKGEMLAAGFQPNMLFFTRYGRSCPSMPIPWPSRCETT